MPLFFFHSGFLHLSFLKCLVETHHQVSFLNWNIGIFLRVTNSISTCMYVEAKIEFQMCFLPYRMKEIYKRS